MCLVFGAEVVKGWWVLQIIGVIMLELAEIVRHWDTGVFGLKKNGGLSILFLPIKILMGLFSKPGTLNRVMNDCIMVLFHFMWISEYFRFSFQCLYGLKSSAVTLNSSFFFFFFLGVCVCFHWSCICFYSELI